MLAFEAATDEKMTVTIVALATFLQFTKEDVDERRMEKKRRRKNENAIDSHRAITDSPIGRERKCIIFPFQ